MRARAHTHANERALFTSLSQTKQIWCRFLGSKEAVFQAENKTVMLHKNKGNNVENVAAMCLVCDIS